MAFNDTLFQLGMDLTRSSPAQKEDLAVRAQGARTALEETTATRASARNHAGRHLIVDLFGARRLDDIGHVEQTLRECVEAAGGTLLHMHVQPLVHAGGVTGVAVLEESHIAIHSWPETGYAALDIFMSGSADPARAVPVLRKAFEAAEVRVSKQLRGTPAEARGPVPEKAKEAKPRASRARKAMVAA